MFIGCAYAISSALLAASDPVGADQAMEAFRLTVSSVKGYEAEVRVERALFADVKMEGDTFIRTPKESPGEFVDFGRYLYREQGEWFYCKMISAPANDLARLSLAYDGLRLYASEDADRRKGYVQNISGSDAARRRDSIAFRSPWSLILPNRAVLRARAGYTQVDANHALPWKLVVSPNLIDLNGFSTIRLEFHYGLWFKLHDTDADSEARFEERWNHSAAWLDPEAGHLPRRVDVYERETGKVLHRCDVTRFAALPSGQYFPLEGVLTDYTLGSDGTYIVYQKYRLTVNPDSLRVGMTFNQSAFQMDWGRRAFVVDRDVSPVATQATP